MSKLAKEKVWVAVDGTTLVPDGDEMAAVLLAMPGASVSDDELARYENADEFFEAIPKHGDKPAEKKNVLKEGEDDLEHHKKHHRK